VVDDIAVGEKMSKRFASDQPDEAKAAGEPEANRSERDKSQDLQSSALEELTLARLYRSEKIAERFVGRAEELAKLKRLFDLSVEGKAKPVFVVGDPGIGKTELVQHFFIELQQVDNLSLTGRYFDVASGAPYKIFYDSLYDLADLLERNVFQENSPLTITEVKALQACLKEIRDISSSSMIQEPEADRTKYNTFDLLAQSYRMLTKARPVVLFLDDLQWADELSLEFLAYLIREMKEERFFIICTVREHEITLEGNPLRTWMRRMSRYNAYEQLKLLPLTEQETESLLDLIFSTHSFTESDIRLLNRETGGNPYYLLEIIKQLIEDRKIYFKEGCWTCEGLDEVRLPKSLIDLVELQLGRLDKETLVVFEKAAVIGEEFSFTLLQSVLGIDEEKLAQAIEKGLREFLIREESHSSLEDSERYTFYYNTTRKVLYEKLATRKRRAIHMKAAKFLEARQPDERSVGNLAHHYYQAGEMASAFSWCVEAGVITFQRFAFDQTKKYLDWAARTLTLLQESKNPPGSQLLAKYYSTHGQLKSAFGEYEHAVELLRKAQSIYKETGERYKEAELLLSMANSLKLASSVSESLKAYNQTLSIARELSAQNLKWPAFLGAARCEAELGHPELAEQLLYEGLKVIDGLIGSVPETEREYMTSSRTEIETLLQEVKNRLEKSQAERGTSGSYQTLETQVCQSSTPDTSSRVVEITNTHKENFKKYALWFKLLHNTTEILNKLSKTQVNPPRVVGSIFNGLKQLKGHLDELDPVIINSHLSVLEKQLQEYQSWLQMINEMLPPFTMRRYLDDKILSQEEMLQLARFIVMVQSESRDDKGKAELLLTHALVIEVNRKEIITSLFPLETVFNPLSPDNPQLQLLESILKEIDKITSYSDFIKSNLTNRMKQTKAEFGQLFWHPEILSVLIEIDLRVDLRLRELLEKEQREISAICNQLLRLGIKILPRRGPAGALDVEAAKRMIERAEDLLNNNYESNLPGLMMLAEVGRYLRTYLEEQGIVITPDEASLNPFIDPDATQSTLPQASSRALPSAATTSSYEERQNQGSQIKYSSDKISIPFMGGTTEMTAHSTAVSERRMSGPAIEQIETKLQSRLAEICILLATKLRGTPIKVLHLKRSQLAIGSWEVDALLSTEDEAVTATLNQQNYLIRRSIALLAEMQEVGISCREFLSAGKRAEAEASLATAEYFLDQTKLITAELETHSHRERDAGEYTRAQNLAATRQKILSTQQLLTTLISWLKREMEKS
jgi:hypothetical protein